MNDLSLHLEESSRLSYPVRICSFIPSATETIFALGLGSQLFGVTHECDFPEAAREKPRLTRSLIDPSLASSSRKIDDQVAKSLGSGGGIYELDFAALRDARPDIIFTQELCEVCAVSYGEIFRAAKRLPKKPEIVSLDTFSLGDILRSIKVVGERCGRKSEADRLVRDLENRIERATALCGALLENGRMKRKRVFFMEWVDPIMTCGHWIPELLRRAGSEDEFGRDGKNSLRITWEEVRRYAPEYVIVAPCGFGVERAEEEARRFLANLDGWKELPAAKLGNVWATDGNAYFSRPGPRTVDGLEILATMLNFDELHNEYAGKFAVKDMKRLEI